MDFYIRLGTVCLLGRTVSCSMSALKCKTMHYSKYRSCIIKTIGTTTRHLGIPCLKHWGSALRGTTMKKELHFLFMGMSHDQHLHRVAKCIEQQNGLRYNLSIVGKYPTSQLHHLCISEKKITLGTSFGFAICHHFSWSRTFSSQKRYKATRSTRATFCNGSLSRLAQGKAVFPRLTEGTFDQYKAIDLHMAKQAQLQTPVSLSTLCPWKKRSTLLMNKGRILS